MHMHTPLPYTLYDDNDDGDEDVCRGYYVYVYVWPYI